MQLRVTPVAGRMVAAIDGDGRPLRGRFVGHDAARVFSDAAVLLPDHPHYRRAIDDGDLVLVEEVVS